MGLNDELTSSVRSIFKDQWETREGSVVPESSDLKLSNDAVKLDATILYADLSASTSMVDRFKRHLSAEIYKAFLLCAAKVIRANGGEITAYDGDRIMAVFLGDAKNSSAAKCGLKIHWAVKEIVNPQLKKHYDTDYKVRHTVGIDSGDVWVARTGIRGANDLVWVGYAANYAAKLNELSSDYPTWITHRVYNKLNESAKFAKDGRNMWESRKWTSMNDLSIYRSSFWWPLS